MFPAPHHLEAPNRRIPRKRPWSIFVLLQRLLRSHLFTSARVLRTKYSARRLSWRDNPVSHSPACYAAVPPGRMAFLYSEVRDRRHLKHGSPIAVLKISK